MVAARRLGRAFASASAGALLLAVAAPAFAQATLTTGYGGTVGYGTDCLYPNDDGSSPIIDLTPAFPTGLLFFGDVHSSAYVNTNGNITFSGPVSTYTPFAFPIAAQPMIAPYWGDVDIRNTGGVCMGSAGVTCTSCTPCLNPSENGVWWHLEPGLMVVTWDRVGYYSCHNNLRMNFQLILTAAGCGGAGDFDVEFRYNLCEWETGDASGGSGGFGGTEAQAGFDAGNLIDFVAIPGSLAAGIATTLCTSSNVGTTGVWQFAIRSGAVICPDAGTPCSTGMLGVCGSGRTNCVGMGTECVQDVGPSSEQCDALDNDCDGLVDETDAGPLCPGTQVCAAGNCVVPCSESFCGPGLVCDTVSGLCIESSCVGIKCPMGERCDGGMCVGACEGVACPFGQDCRAGSCIDLCDGLTCDSCTACEDGTCVSRCEYTPCAAGETCGADGLCLADACVGVDCMTGFHCEGGGCVDDCTGAVCPTGQTCTAGACVPIPPGSDAGVVGGTDGGVVPPADGGILGSDSGTGVPPPMYRGGCRCSLAGGESVPPAAPLGLGLALATFLVLARRRPRR